ncbi:hypothetical protein FRC11_010935 [Ceratobasidium sp. 423]|nr:hypothetical protein FRC11_010935 [Ceratobasidium sp. 423]
MLLSALFFTTLSTFFTGGSKKEVLAIPLVMYGLGLEPTYPVDAPLIQKQKEDHVSYELRELRSTQQGLVHVLSHCSPLPLDIIDALGSLVSSFLAPKAFEHLLQVEQIMDTWAMDGVDMKLLCKGCGLVVNAIEMHIGNHNQSNQPLAEVVLEWKEALSPICDWPFMEAAHPGHTDKPSLFYHIQLQNAALITAFNMRKEINKHPILLIPLRLAAHHHFRFTSLQNNSFWFKHKLLSAESQLEYASIQKFPWVGASAGDTGFAPPAPLNTHVKAKGTKARGKTYKSASVIPSELDHSSPPHHMTSPEQLGPTTVPNKPPTPVLPINPPHPPQPQVQPCPNHGHMATDAPPAAPEDPVTVPLWVLGLPFHFVAEKECPDFRTEAQKQFLQRLEERQWLFHAIQDPNQADKKAEHMKTCETVTRHASKALQDVVSEHKMLRKEVDEAAAALGDLAIDMITPIAKSNLGTSVVAASAGMISTAIKLSAVTELSRVISKVTKLPPFQANIEALRVWCKEPEFATQDVFTVQTDDNGNHSLRIASWAPFGEQLDTQVIPMQDTRKFDAAKAASLQWRPVMSSGSTELEASTRAQSMVTALPSDDYRLISPCVGVEYPNASDPEGADLTAVGNALPTQLHTTIHTQDMGVHPRHIQWDPRAITQRSSGLWNIPRWRKHVVPYGPEDALCHELLAAMAIADPTVVKARPPPPHSPTPKEKEEEQQEEQEEKDKEELQEDESAQGNDPEWGSIWSDSNYNANMEVYQSDEEKDHNGNIRDFIDDDDAASTASSKSDDGEERFNLKDFLTQQSPIHTPPQAHTPSCEPEENDIDYEAMEARDKAKLKKEKALRQRIAPFLASIQAVEDNRIPREDQMETDEVVQATQEMQQLQVVQQDATPVSGPSRKRLGHDTSEESEDKARAKRTRVSGTATGEEEEEEEEDEAMEEVPVVIPSSVVEEEEEGDIYNE